MAKRKNGPEKSFGETMQDLGFSKDPTKGMDQLATIADLYVTPPQLKTEVHEWSGFNLNKDGKAVGKMKHWIQKVTVESFGEWGDYDGEKIAEAMEKAAERELNRQAKQYINRKIQEETNGT